MKTKILHTLMWVFLFAAVGSTYAAIFDGLHPWLASAIVSAAFSFGFAASAQSSEQP